jgi:hypothetical protein
MIAVFAITGTLVPGQWKFWAGVLTGAVMAAYTALRDSPPWHIEKWRAGSEGEQRTARALRSLQRDRWRVWHDRASAGGTNIDHMVMGDPGTFLLDSKNFSGEGTVENGRLRVRWLEDPEDGWVCEGLSARMRAAAADLKERIEAATGERPWVQPIVVLWMKFPQSVAEDSGVFFVLGDEVSAWLESRQPTARRFDAAAISRFLDTFPSSG